MAILTTRPRGTNDFLPAETPRWQYVERTLLSTAALYGYGEIRTPTFEHTELFQRGVGDTTDVVNKEMYTFTDKGDRSITLRPEGTAGICRAAIENGLLGDALPLKVSYVFNCFRYEKAQRGRFRQFHQCISENVLEQGRHSFRIGYETLSGDGIELAGSVPFGGVFLGRGEAFSFDRVEMQYFGTFEVFNVTQYPRKVLYVMAIDRTEVADVHSFEYILLLGGH